MERINYFVAIFQKSDGTYYSSDRFRNMKEIPIDLKSELTDLVYDCRTKIVYCEIYNGNKCICRHPYLSENGKYCHYIDGKIVEL